MEIVGTVTALILNVLVDVALLKLVMVPELLRFTIPAALLVIPAIVPDPFKFIVPVLVKLASTVVIAPEPLITVVPELVSVVIEQVPLMLRVLEFVNVPNPEMAVVALTVPLLVSTLALETESNVPQVRVPLFVYVPENAADGIEVMVSPLNTLVVPEKVCVPVFAVNVVALFAKLPPKLNGAATVSFHIPPLLIVTLLRNVLEEVPPKVNVPVIFVAPVMPMVELPVIANSAPVPIVRIPPNVLPVVSAKVLVPEPETVRFPK